MLSLETSLSGNWEETGEGMYITLILGALGLDKGDLEKDPLYTKEVNLKGYPIDTLISLLISKNLFIEDDYQTIRSGTTLNGLIRYYLILQKRYQGISRSVNQILQ